MTMIIMGSENDNDKQWIFGDYYYTDDHSEDLLQGGYSFTVIDYLHPNHTTANRF